MLSLPQPQVSVQPQSITLGERDAYLAMLYRFGVQDARDGRYRPSEYCISEEAYMAYDAGYTSVNASVNWTWTVVQQAQAVDAAQDSRSAAPACGNGW